MRHKLIPQIIFSILSIAFFASLSYQPARAQVDLFSDSSLAVFSVQDLVEIRKVLARERENLLGRQERISERGVEVTKEFLGQTKGENSNQDKILVRVAEYYIEEEDLSHDRRVEQYEAQYAEYERQLKGFESGQLKAAPAEPQYPAINYQEAISIYDLIIGNFPESDLVDDAYYNKAFLLGEMDETEASRQIYQTIIDEFPESQYAPEAYMKLAESYFYPEPGDSMQTTILKLNKSIQLYKNVLQYKDSPRYDEALYKLGWSYYRLAGEDPNYYTDAIVYFMGVVQDIEKLQDLDPTGEIIRADVKPEALQFIAASFIDPDYKKSGVRTAREFLERLSKPQFGIDIIENIGDRYAKITKWTESIQAYYELLSMYPEYAYAPRIQKKIADAYISDNQYERAFEERRYLFESYNPQSEWYAQLELRDMDDRIAALDAAYRITEEAFRTNITYLYEKAQLAEADSVSTFAEFTEFVDLCQRYLENYPTDENAYEINWALAFVLDLKLGRYEEAFTEYIKVSNDYLETSHQENAAINAINAADSLVKIRMAAEDPTQLSGSNLPTQLQTQDLTNEEKMLAEAYDNFIKLFPNSTQTPTVLASAGALYYNHRQYDLAKKYYKTMVTKFPQSQQKSIGLISLMNSYFFLGQYKDAEIVAKKILETPEMPSDQLEIAKNRIGESIYKNGEKLEQEGLYLEAAREYKRVYEEASEYVTFVDLALFKSSRNFEQAGEWLRAIEAYEILVADFPQSKQVLPALNNIATDYKELEDFVNVASTYERIFELFPGTPEAENALYNASLFYSEAEAWSEAIRANNTYIATYPTNPESKDLLFENAKFFLKLDDLASANRIYEEFATAYPTDPLTIEAFYNRGVYYFERTRHDSAKAEFNKAIQRSNDFARAGRDPNLFFAAEANYKLGQILYDEYKGITLSYPQNTLRAQLDRKSAKLTEVQDVFREVISIGSVRSFEAMFRIAEAYEELANSIADQVLEPNLTPERRLVEEDRVFNASVPAYSRAVEEYKNVLVNLPSLAEKLGVSLDSTATVVPPEIEEVIDSTVLVQKTAEIDSSREVALKWHGKARERISLIQYGVAERSSDFITQYLRVDNPNTGLRALVYQDQVLRQLVAPQVNTTIEAHLKNLAVSQELGLQNKYVEESQRKVVLARNILAEEYAKLFSQAADIYGQTFPVLEGLLEQGESATTPEGFDFYDYQDGYILQIIFSMNQYSQIALSQYKSTLEVARQNSIRNDAVLTTEQNMFNFGYEVGSRLKLMAQQPAQKSEEYFARFDSTGNENMQLGSTFFDDQNYELTAASQQIFEASYNLGKELAVDNIWTQLVVAELVEIDPATYAADLPKEEFVVAADTTWLSTTTYAPGWNLQEFSAAGWTMAHKVDGAGAQGFDSLGVFPVSIWTTYIADDGLGATGSTSLEMQDFALDDTLQAIEEIGTLEEDSLVQSPVAMIDTLADSLGPGLATAIEPDTVTAYFRQTFNLGSTPIDGWIAIAGGESFQLYVNDIYMVGVDAGGSDHIQYLPFSTLDGVIRSGQNLVAVSVSDYDGPPRDGLQLHMLFKLLPGDVQDVVNRIKADLQPQDIPASQLEKNAVTNKNRIIQ